MVDPVKYEDSLDQVLTLLEARDFDAATDVLRALHPADAAEILSELEKEDQAELATRLNTEDLAELLEQMEEEEMAEVAEHLDKDRLVDVLDEMEADVAADLLGEFEPEEAAKLIGEMDEGHEVGALLSYPDDSAGGIMNVPPPSLRRWMKVREAIHYLRENYQDAEDIYYLYVLDRNGRLIGLVNLRSMVLADQEQTIESIMRKDIVSLRVDADQEDAAQLLARYDLLAVPVVDHDDRLVGIITVDDLMDVIEKEATEDIYHLAQVGVDSEMFSSIDETVRSRLPWLVVNLATAFLAAAVVALFQDTISQVALLAAFLPIVAGQGGNAGTQTMTVVVRSLALREVTPKDTPAALWHEILAGILNGLAIGLLVALVTLVLTRNGWLAGVVGLAMLGNMLVAAVFGTLVPMALRRLGVDPAISSSIFVTTATDVFGFLFFLSLASIAIAHLT